MSLFPSTRLSLVHALASDDAHVRAIAFERVVRIYRTPVIEVVRRQWQLEPADAEDLAHDFFLVALDRDWMQRFDPARGRFRTFLRACVRDFANAEHRRAHALKRGGFARAVPVEDADLAAADADADSTFDHEWARSVLDAALDALEAECRAAGRERAYQVFRAYDVEGADLREPPTYAALAEAFGLPVTQVANHLHWTRQRFRHAVLETLRSLTASDAEFRGEVRALLGHDLP
ncbi:MAG: sigma-70 family RNA polymerase sigma factor [Gemmatimonadetes bacterium]|nr:sigma-70 family RNA polymerase sigma factor [Gemmatimonadota bacterium]